jgi:hypothetical protein
MTRYPMSSLAGFIAPGTSQRQSVRGFTRGCATSG